MSTATDHPVPDRVKPPFVIFDIRALRHSAPDRQSARMSKITNDGSTRSGTGCFVIVVPVWQQRALRG